MIVSDLGDDAIDIFPIDPATAKFGQMEPHRFTNNHPGAGATAYGVSSEPAVGLQHQRAPMRQSTGSSGR